jgi:hypothetical protein
MAAVVARIESELVVIEFDAMPLETHTLACAITDHPVEVGANVSDHARPEPDMLALECVISNTPLTTVQQQRAIRLGTVDFTAENALEIMPDRANICYAQLDFLRSTGALLTVVTTLRVYESMVIQSLTVPRSAQNSNGLHFTLALKQIRIVQNQFTRTPKVSKAGTGKKVDTGQQTPKVEPPKKKETALHKMNLVDKLDKAQKAFERLF